MGGADLVFPQENFEIGLSFDLVEKKNSNIFFSLEDANILKTYCMQYSKQAHKILASSDEKNYFFFS